MRYASTLLKINSFVLCLIVGAWLAVRHARETSDTSPSLPSAVVPRTAQEIAAAALTRGLTICPECMDGVIANLSLLATHADRMRGELEGRVS